MVASCHLRLLPKDDLDILETGLAEFPARHRSRGTPFAKLRIGKIDEAVRLEVRVDRHIEQSPLLLGENFAHAGRGFDMVPSLATSRSVPGRSVTSICPSGRKVRAQGWASPLATVSTLIGPA